MPPPLPVQTYRQQFLDYIRGVDVVASGHFIAPTPERTVLDILGPVGAPS
ncbi:MAG: hypothetical protein LC749_22110 [Actinobacteria bacterium]|nr:hypothetical protein [Actinomycetota bacterium]